MLTILFLSIHLFAQSKAVLSGGFQLGSKQLIPGEPLVLIYSVSCQVKSIRLDSSFISPNGFNCYITRKDDVRKQRMEPLIIQEYDTSNVVNENDFSTITFANADPTKTNRFRCFKGCIVSLRNLDLGEGDYLFHIDSEVPFLTDPQADWRDYGILRSHDSLPFSITAQKNRTIQSTITDVFRLNYPPQKPVYTPQFFASFLLGIDSHETKNFWSKFITQVETKVKNHEGYWRINVTETTDIFNRMIKAKDPILKDILKKKVREYAAVWPYLARDLQRSLDKDCPLPENDQDLPYLAIFPYELIKGRELEKFYNFGQPGDTFKLPPSKGT